MYIQRRSNIHMYMYIQRRSNIPEQCEYKESLFSLTILEHTVVCHIQVACFISLLPQHTFCVCSTEYDKGKKNTSCVYRTLRAQGKFVFTDHIRAYHGVTAYCMRLTDVPYKYGLFSPCLQATTIQLLCLRYKI